MLDSPAHPQTTVTAQTVYDVPPEDERAYLKRSYESYVEDYNALVRRFWSLAALGELRAARDLRARIERVWPPPASLAGSPWVPVDSRHVVPLPSPGGQVD